jgi:hypothetical protein
MDQPDVRFGISHDFEEESIEAKARWFQALTMEERNGSARLLDGAGSSE